MKTAPDPALSTRTVKRSVAISGHLTSISLEEPFWHELQSIARSRGITLSKLIADIDRKRGTGLSSALRLYVFHSLKNSTSEDIL